MAKAEVRWLTRRIIFVKQGYLKRLPKDAPAALLGRSRMVSCCHRCIGGPESVNWGRTGPITVGTEEAVSSWANRRYR